jgi:ribosomal-protein-alanine N-acetyltransferase
MDQNKPPLLFTSSTELIELMPEHARDVFAFTSDEQVAKTAIWDAHKTSDDSLLYINHVRSRISFDPKNLFLCWGIKELSTQKIIGFITLTEIGGIRAQIGYVFHYKKWDSKLPAECLQVVTQKESTKRWLR